MFGDNSTIRESGATVPEGVETVYENGAATITQAALSDAARRGSVVVENLAIQKGMTLLETYRVESDAIEGGMGSVWRVRHTGWNVDLAMKRPQPQCFSTEKSKADFIRECEAWINLGLHPNIVSCYYVREIGGTPTIFSEWMNGGSLENAVKSGALYQGTQPQQQERILDIAIQFARGLHYAHEAGLIHQDVKPDNLLLTKEGEAKVADFGLARARAVLTVRESAAAAQNTAESGKTILSPSGGYTPAYCSMEQMDGRELTRRTDIYSWAVSVMELYLGSCPWANGVVAGLKCRDYFKQSRLPMPESLQELLAQCMESESEKRPHDFAVVEMQLLEIYRVQTGKEYPRSAPKVAADTADSLNNRALSYLDLGKNEEAEKCWKRVLQLAQSHTEGLFNTSLYQWRTGTLTDEEACLRILLGSAYYAESSAGKEAISALAREAGKSSYNEPFFNDEPVRKIDMKPRRSIETMHKLPVLWHGLFYCIVENTGSISYGKINRCALFIYDAKTGECVEKNCFPDLVGTYGSIYDISLSPDARVAIIGVSDQFLYYELEHKRVHHTIPKGEPRMYMSYGPFVFLGKQHRYARRMLSSGIGHGPPSYEIWDLFEGKTISNVNSFDLIEIEDNGPPNSEELHAEDKMRRGDISTLTDDLRLITLTKVEDKWYRCDRQGRLLGAANPRILDTRQNGLTMVPRIHGASCIWMLSDRNILEWDAESGKCRRSYPLKKGWDIVLIDEEGLGCIRMTDKEDEETNGEWQYRRLPQIVPENQAQWQLCRVESFQEKVERQQKLQLLVSKFEKCRLSNDGSGALAAYREAVGIPSFAGSAAQDRMTNDLNGMDGIRQICTAALETLSAIITDTPAEIPVDLCIFDLAESVLTGALAERMKNTRWIIRAGTGFGGYGVSMDGKRLLFCGQGAGPAGNPMAQYGEVRAPLGSGIYLWDISDDQLFLLARFTPSSWNPRVSFSSDQQYVILKNGYFGKGIKALAVFRADTGESVCVTNEDITRHSLCLEPQFEGGGTALVWERGIFRFQSEAELAGFTAIQGDKFQVLDVDEQLGLVVYSCRSGEWNEKSVFIWDVVQQKHVFETMRMYANDEILARLSRDRRQILIAPTGLDKKSRIHVYQLGYSYTEGAKRSLAPAPFDLPHLRLPKCDWPREGGNASLPVANKPVKPIPAATPAAVPIRKKQDRQKEKKSANGLFGFFRKK